MAIDWSTIVALVGMVLGGGGVFGWWGARAELKRAVAEADRMRSQSAVDERSQLTKEQVQFRADMAGEIGSLRTEIKNLKEANSKLDDRNNALISENAELKGRIIVLEQQNADLKNMLQNYEAREYTTRRELDTLKGSVRGLERRDQS